MSKFFVPPAPVASWEKRSSERRPDISGQSPVPPSSVSASQAPLDAAFLGRLYRSIAWFGVLATLGVWSLIQSSVAATSVALGIGIGALLLKSQEVLVRRVLQPDAVKSHRHRWSEVLAFWIVALIKYGIVMAVIAWLHSRHQINLIWLLLGFMLVQFVIGAKIIGRVLAGRVRPVRTAYVQDGNEKRNSIRA